MARRQVKCKKCHLTANPLKICFKMNIGHIDLNHFVDGEMPITMEMRSSGELCAAASHVL